MTVVSQLTAEMRNLRDHYRPYDCDPVLFGRSLKRQARL